MAVITRRAVQPVVKEEGGENSHSLSIGAEVAPGQSFVLSIIFKTIFHVTSNNFVVSLAVYSRSGVQH